MGNCCQCQSPRKHAANLSKKLPKRLPRPRFPGSRARFTSRIRAYMPGIPRPYIPRLRYRLTMPPLPGRPRIPQMRFNKRRHSLPITSVTGSDLYQIFWPGDSDSNECGEAFSRNVQTSDTNIVALGAALRNANMRRALTEGYICEEASEGSDFLGDEALDDFDIEYMSCYEFDSSYGSRRASLEALRESGKVFPGQGPLGLMSGKRRRIGSLPTIPSIANVDTTGSLGGSVMSPRNFDAEAEAGEVEVQKRDAKD